MEYWNGKGAGKLAYEKYISTTNTQLIALLLTILFSFILVNVIQFKNWDPHGKWSRDKYYNILVKNNLIRSDIRKTLDINMASNPLVLQAFHNQNKSPSMNQYSSIKSPGSPYLPNFLLGSDSGSPANTSSNTGYGGLISKTPQGYHGSGNHMSNKTFSRTSPQSRVSSEIFVLKATRISIFINIFY